MANITNANLHSKYDMSKVELRVLNSDGGSWIKRLLTEKAIYQADSYHLKEKITTHVRNTEDSEILKAMFYKKEYSKMIEYAEGIKYKYDGEVEELEKLNELQGYLNKRKETMKRYKDYDGVKQKLKTYSKKIGLKYRNMGCQESNNYCRLTRRMKKKYPNLKKILENKAISELVYR